MYIYNVCVCDYGYVHLSQVPVVMRDIDPSRAGVTGGSSSPIWVLGTELHCRFSACF